MTSITQNLIHQIASTCEYYMNGSSTGSSTSTRYTPIFYWCPSQHLSKVADRFAPSLSPISTADTFTVTTKPHFLQAQPWQSLNWAQPSQSQPDRQGGQFQSQEPNNYVHHHCRDCRSARTGPHPHHPLTYRPITKPSRWPRWMWRLYYWLTW